MGGDFYDLIELPNERIGLFIADVADKGMPAALFMALTRTLMRAAVLQTDSPAEALRQVNDLLYPDCEQGMFVTAVYGVLDLKTGKFTYANAGHNPPLAIAVRRGSPDPVVEIDRLTRTGIALGVIEHAEMTERSITLLPGQTLVLYTDGVTESFSPAGEMYGEERLLQMLTASAFASASASASASACRTSGTSDAFRKKRLHKFGPTPRVMRITSITAKRSHGCHSSKL